MRYLIVALFGLHGLLHVIGLQWGKAVGAVWGIASLVLLGAAAMLLLRNDHWWMVAAAGLLLSQILIVTHWKQARAGTVLNLVLAIPIVVAAGQARFHRHSQLAVQRLVARVPATAPAVVTAEELEPLPAPVRRWLQSSGVVGRERAQVVRLHQRGELRTGH